MWNLGEKGGEGAKRKGGEGERKDGGEGGEEKRRLDAPERSSEQGRGGGHSQGNPGTQQAPRVFAHPRARVSKVPGTTRDTLEVRCVYKGTRMKLIDTAGFVRIRELRDRPFREALWKRTRSALRFASVVVVVFDASKGCPSKADLILGYRCVDEGRAVVYAANKWDTVEDGIATAEAIDYKLRRQLYEVKYCNAVAVSGVTGLNLDLLLDSVIRAYETWNRHIPASVLTRFWQRLEKTVSMPHHVTRVRRLQQINIRPPTFLLHLQTRNDRKKLPPRYENMIRNALVEEFGFRGVPLRVFQCVKDAFKDI